MGVDTKETIDQLARMELRVNREIQLNMDRLILRATDATRKLQDSAMEESQLRNLCAVAEKNPMSMLSVTNFIRYQIGRDSRGDRWAFNSFGMAVIKDIEEGVVPELVGRVLADAAGANKARVRGRLIALYTGYLARTFVYARKASGWSNLDVLVANISGEINANS